MTQRASNCEHALRESFDAGRFDETARGVLQLYGAQIFSLIASRVRDQGDAQEVFSMFAEDLWKGLPKFSWRCSLRTWSYTIARNALIRYAAAPQRKAARNLPLARSQSMGSALMAACRSVTPAYLRTDVKSRFRTLRERLEPEDQMLLVLRVDRNLAWRDLAITMAGDVDLNDAALEREAARVRKAFERVKLELRRLAMAEGMLQALDA